MNWTRKKLISSYLKFFKNKNHAIIENSPLIPRDDPTVLFTTAGMHPLVPFLLGQKHPQGKRLCNVQKCVRTTDINEVGDAVHHTFFEMLGNWSLGDYWKKKAIEMSFEFLTKTLKLKKQKFAISCFKGDKDAERDNESAEIWKTLGIPKERILFLGKKENWWGPAGKIGPCGPDTEMFYYMGEGVPKKFNAGDEKWVEIWNDVFMQYNKDEAGRYNEARQKNVDTGMGVERTVAVLQGSDDNYKTEIFWPIIQKIQELSKKNYGKDIGQTRSMRIIADHIRASVFILSENIQSSNLEQGYVLRRLIRRAVRYGKGIGIQNFTKKLGERVIEINKKDYKYLEKNKKFILKELEREEQRFLKGLEKGLRVFEKIKNELRENRKREIPGQKAFLLYQSYGFPLETTEELATQSGLKVNKKSYEEQLKKHQELSRTATKGRFKSGLADKTEKTTKLHTATHLLLAALRQVLSNEIVQKGSNITEERLRLDFDFPRKLTNEELKKVEKVINERIKQKLIVDRKEMTFQEAKKSGALGIFEHKYGNKVSVYSISKFSKEICAGPHVKNTSKLGKFKIIKEESVASGIRRIKAVLE